MDGLDIIDLRPIAAATALMPFVLGITQAVKQFLLDNNRYAPIVALLAGVVLAFVAYDATVRNQVFAGLVSGLMACGLYAGGKAVVEGS